MLRLVTFLTIAFLFTAFGASVRADDWKDCEGNNPEASIRGCSAILARGRETPANRAIAFSNRGAAYGKKGDNGRAIAGLNRAIEINPKDANYYNSRAWAYFKAGEAAEGLPDAEKSLELRPNEPNTLNMRGHNFEALGRREEAISD